MKGEDMNHEHQPQGGESSDSPRPEREPQERPQIYVASLSDYNDGRLHGAWIDAAQDAEQLAEAVRAMLDHSPDPSTKK
jgi:hypothetical protein